MSTQRVETKTVDLTAADFRSGDAADVLAEHAADGWSVAAECNSNGTTIGYVLERPLTE